MTGTHRALISGPMVGLGIIISIWGIVTWGQLPVMVQTTTKIEYKQADPPQEYSTGPVFIKLGWVKNNTHADGEYQLETPGGIVSVIKLCPPEPDFNRGDLVEILYANKKTQADDCFPFVRARRLK
jgi:hypothetical protein